MKGFTLIELLVVVLIIGILSAVALPQYQKAVEKSRAATMLANMRALANAQNLYFMANGSYPKAFGDLDVSFDSLPIKRSSSQLHRDIPSTDAVRENGLYELIINATSSGSTAYSTVLLISGPYRGGGFTIPHKTGRSFLTTGEIYCVEVPNTSAQDKFCKQLYGAQLLQANVGAANWYKMP